MYLEWRIRPRGPLHSGLLDEHWKGNGPAMSKNLEQKLQSRIAAFANDITAILQSAVADSVADALAVRGRAGAQVGGRRGANADFSEDALLREIKREGGRRMEQISAALKTPSRQLKGPMKRLLAAKKIRTVGQARGTKYTAA